MNFNVKLHTYADETQLYLQYKLNEFTARAVDDLQNWIAAINEWMPFNKLISILIKLNWCWSVPETFRMNFMQGLGPSVSVGGIKVIPSGSFRILGVTVPDLQLYGHIKTGSVIYS